MRSPLQNRIYRKDFPAEVTQLADRTVTNGTTNRIAVLPLGSVIGPGVALAGVSAFEWAQVPAATRTAFQLTSV